MPKRLTTQEFIAKAKVVHGDRYDYSRVEYRNNREKVEIICPKHKESFWQKPNDHISNGSGCPRCGNESMVKNRKIAKKIKPLTTQKFIKRAKVIHGVKYDYSKVIYVRSIDKVEIICIKHKKSFWQEANSHLQGAGCPDCSNELRSRKRISTKERFIEKAQEKYGNKFDYSRVIYINSESEVEIICPIHQSFFQTPSSHLANQFGCPACGIDLAIKKRTLTNEEFIAKSKMIHGNKYDYSQTVYIKGSEKVKIRCKKHDDFWKTGNDHLAGRGCPKCGNESSSEKNSLTTQEFIKRSKEVHRDKYDYSRVEYNRGSVIKVEILCLEHGMFKQLPAHHLQGRGCPDCAGVKIPSTKEFIEKAKEVHGDKYDYSKTKYKHSNIAVKIKCFEHGVFSKRPYNHLQGSGCPVCSAPSGEVKISYCLKKWGIDFIRQKKFKECKNKECLPFDFYFQIKDCHFLIEFDGKQHFKPIEFFGGKKSFELLKKNDAIKTQFAENYGFILIRIPYTKHNKIEYILKEIIEKHTKQPLMIQLEHKRKRGIKAIEGYQPPLF